MADRMSRLLGAIVVVIVVVIGLANAQSGQNYTYGKSLRWRDCLKEQTRTLLKWAYRK